MENWRMEPYSVEKLGKEIDEGKIKVPKYQRGIVWNSKQKEKLIDSMKKGYPFGSILLSGPEDNREIVDGLQRSRTIIDFVKNPASFFNADYLKEEDIKKILDYTSIDNSVDVVYDKIVEVIKQWVNQEHNDMVSIQRMQFVKLYDKLEAEFPTLSPHKSEILDLLPDMFNDFQTFCADMSRVQVPTLIYFGDPDLLPEIFERINSQGSTLTKQEIYAAAWANDFITFTSDEYNDILKINRDRYDNMLGEGMDLGDYDSRRFMLDKTVNLFELVFGFGKMLSKKYPYLFSYDENDPTKVESVGFNLINACLLQKSGSMRSLNKAFKEYIGLSTGKVVSFLNKVMEAAGYVDGKLSDGTKFKGNSRNNSKVSPIFSEMQVVSMVATVFIARHVKYSIDDNGNVYDISVDSEHYSDKWANMKDRFSKNVLRIATIDMLTTKWKGTGDKKLDNIIIDQYYYNREITWNDFEQILDVYYNSLNNERNEREKIASPKDTEKLILNLIYSQIFTAADQMNDSKFDIEHLATKDLMKRRISSYDEDFRLPISSIGNLCLLPEYDNRTKKNLTLYQDPDYLNSVDISMVESKYSFTTEESMEWLNDTNLSQEEFKEAYFDFIDGRYEKIKELLKNNLF